MPVKIKICGLTRTDDALATARAGADFAGLVFHPRSPRHLSPEKARTIAQSLRGRVRIVALLADPNDDTLEEVVAAAKPDFVQLHGRETPSRVADVRRRFAIPVIKAISISDTSDLAVLPDYEAVADMLLLDGKPPSGAPGGGGCAFDWQLLRNRVIRRPWLLAGGLNVQNVARAISTTGAPGVDVSSGVELSPGVKNAEAISSFVTAARAVGLVAEQSA